MRLCLAVSALDAFGEVDLLSFGEKGSLADLVQVHLDSVAGVATTQIALHNLFDELGVLFLVAKGVIEELGIYHLHAMLAKEAVYLLDLLGREVHFLEEVEDFAGL